MQDVMELSKYTIQEKKHKLSVVFDDMIAVINNKKLNWVVTELLLEVKN